MCVLLPSGETWNYINIRKERSRLWDHSSALINLNEDERIFLKKGEILGCLEPSPIEITEIVKEEESEIGEEDEEEDESIPLEKKCITSPAEVNTHRRMQLQDAEVTEENGKSSNCCVKSLKIFSLKILQI